MGIAFRRDACQSLLNWDYIRPGRYSVRAHNTTMDIMGVRRLCGGKVKADPFGGRD
jgi:hypothetical protein